MGERRSARRMSRVVAAIEFVDLQEEEGGPTYPGVVAQCKDCQYQTSCYGTSDRSIKRALAQLQEGCPRNQQNFYITEEADEEVDVDAEDPCEEDE